jgi:hypothetical protein
MRRYRAGHLGKIDEVQNGLETNRHRRRGISHDRVRPTEKLCVVAPCRG